MDVTGVDSGPPPSEATPVNLVVLHSEEDSEGQDAPPRVYGTDGVDDDEQELIDGLTDDNSEDDWDIDSLIEDAIEELSDEQLLGGEYMYPKCPFLRRAKYSL